MALFVTVEIGEMTQVLASRAGNVGSMDIGSWDRVFLGLLMIEATLLLFLFLKAFLGGLTFFEPLEM